MYKYEIIQEYFMNHLKEWKTIRQVSDDLDIKYSTVATIVTTGNLCNMVERRYRIINGKNTMELRY